MIVGANISFYMLYFKRATAPLMQFRVMLSSFGGIPKSSAIQMSCNKYESSNSKGRSPLIIMHGLFGSKTNWNSMSKALQKNLNRNIITVDARNHGESEHTDDFSYNHMAADINRLYEDLNLSSACIMGHSMGGRTMMLFALNYPEKVEKLIVVDITPFPSSRKMHSMKFYFDSMKAVKLSKDLSMTEARKQAYQQLSQRITDDNVTQFLLTNLVRKEDGNYNWRLNLDVLATKFDSDIVQFPLESNLKCDKPTLFIGGKMSDYLSPADESDIAKLFPAAKFTYLDCGHWVHAEKPHEFLSVVQNFINNPS